MTSHITKFNIQNELKASTLKKHKSQITKDISLINKSSIEIIKNQYNTLQQQLKLVQYPTHAISQAKQLNQKISSFKNQLIFKKLSDKLFNLNSYRQVRGDGNCFFRAVAFSFFSAKQELSYEACFPYISEVTLTCCAQESIPKVFLKFYDKNFLRKVLQKNWQKVYRKCYEESKKLQMKALLKLFNQNPYLDFIVILYFRAVCLCALLQFHKQLEGFLTGDEQQLIRTYQKQSQGISIHLIAKKLKILIKVYEVRKDQVLQYQYQQVIGSKIFSKIKNNNNIQINLLYYQNHYDIIQHNDCINAQKSVVKDIPYISQISKEMEKGNCQLCGQNGMIYKDSQICKICFCNSRETVKEYEIKDKTERGRCSQCGQLKQILADFHLCKQCQNFVCYHFKKEQEEKLLKKTYCLMCKKYQPTNQETGLCLTCTNKKKQQQKQVYRRVIKKK